MRPRVVVSVVGVGLVGGEFVDQLSKLPSPGLRDQFKLLSLSSSRSTVYYGHGIDRDVWSNWRHDLKTSDVKSDVEAVATTLEQVSVQEGMIPVFVDNTSSEDVARLYPFFLNKGINIVTPNKKALSSQLTFYEDIVKGSFRTGAKFYYESTVGAGLPIITTLENLVVTGDKVRKNTRTLSPPAGVLVSICIPRALSGLTSFYRSQK